MNIFKKTHYHGANILRRLNYFIRFLGSFTTMNLRLLWGMWKLTKLPQPAVTVFGGSRVQNDSKHALQARELAKKLASKGYSIITGGGPGIMEAANYGAVEYLKECNLEHPNECKTIMSAGIGLIKLNLEKENKYTQDHITMSHFFTRKWLLVRYSEAFIIFPGGFGTLDEFFEIITLRQTNKMQEAPIILIDTAYWQPILDWCYEQALPAKLIDQADLKLFVVTDSIDDACFLINQQFCAANGHQH